MMSPAEDAVNTVANLAIVAGYLAVPVALLPHRLPLPGGVQVSGALFFITCALTHSAMAFGWEHRPWMIVDHCVQAVAVVWFVTSMGRLLRRAVRVPRDQVVGPPGRDEL